MQRGAKLPLARSVVNNCCSRQTAVVVAARVVDVSGHTLGRENMCPVRRDFKVSARGKEKLNSKRNETKRKERGPAI